MERIRWFYLIVILELLFFSNCKNNSNDDTVKVTDYDGNTYSTVKIGYQVWMTENLKTTKYSNGDSISFVPDNIFWINHIWSNLTSGAYCSYLNIPSNTNTYGRLYNWFTVADNRNICPTGWHVPTDAEWTILETFLGGGSVAGGKMKEIGTSHWIDPNKGADNSSGFTALPGGFRENDGSFDYMQSNSFWWTSSEGNATSAWYRVLYNQDSFFNRVTFEDDKNLGLSVRCLKDN